MHYAQVPNAERNALFMCMHMLPDMNFGSGLLEELRVRTGASGCVCRLSQLGTDDSRILRVRVLCSCCLAMLVTICIVFLTPFERSVTTCRRVCFTPYADIPMIMHNQTVLVANMVLKRTHMVCIPAIAVACSTTVLPRDAHTLTSEIRCVSSPF